MKQRKTSGHLRPAGLLVVGISAMTSLWGFSTAEAETPVLHILMDHYPPYSYKDDNGNIRGLAVEKARALMAATGLPYDMTIVSWPRAFTRASTEPNILMFSLSYTAERANSFHWILPLKKTEFHLFGRKSYQSLAGNREAILAPPHTGICEAKTLQCQLLEHYGFPKDRILAPVATNTAGRIRLILRGRADFIVAEPRVIDWLTQNAHIPADAIISYAVVGDSVTDYIAASLDTPPATVARLKAAARTIPMIDAVEPASPHD